MVLNCIIVVEVVVADCNVGVRNEVLVIAAFIFISETRQDNISYRL